MWLVMLSFVSWEVVTCLYHGHMHTGKPRSVTRERSDPTYRTASDQSPPGRTAPLCSIRRLVHDVRRRLGGGRGRCAHGGYRWGYGWCATHLGQGLTEQGRYPRPELRTSVCTGMFISMKVNKLFLCLNFVSVKALYWESNFSFPDSQVMINLLVALIISRKIVCRFVSVL